MAFNFAFILTILTFITGIACLLRRYKRIRSMARTLFPVFLTVWLIRSFAIQPYHVPTGSLEPTIKPGDFIIVSQFSYGLHFPVTRIKFLSLGEPKRGDIALFQWPKNTKVIFIKRVIGLPGDHIVYKNKILYINGLEAKQHFIKSDKDYGDAPGQTIAVNLLQEKLTKKKHNIYEWPSGGEIDNVDIIVPPHEYFMMGDNRDNSDDSRDWGFVPEQNLIGKAFAVLFSWDPVHHQIRWSRMGKKIQ